MDTSARDFAEVHRDLAQTTMWVVSLAAGLLALLGSKDVGILSAPSFRVWLGVSLFATVLMGVAQRVAHQRQHHWERLLVVGVRTDTLDMVADVESTQPLPPTTQVTPEHVEDFLARYMGVPVTGLVNRALSPARLQELYAQAYEQWREAEESKRRRFFAMLEAIRTNVNDDVALSAKAQKVQRWENLSNMLYMAMLAFFLVAGGVLMLAVIAR